MRRQVPFEKSRTAGGKGSSILMPQGIPDALAKGTCPEQFIASYMHFYIDLGLTPVITKRSEDGTGNVPIYAYAQWQGRAMTHEEARMLAGRLRVSDGYGISILNGMRRDSTVMTVDCDSPEATKITIDRMNELAHPELLETLAVKGRPGHAKFIYIIDEPVHLKNRTVIKTLPEGNAELLGEMHLSAVPPTVHAGRGTVYAFAGVRGKIAVLTVNGARFLLNGAFGFSMDDAVSPTDTELTALRIMMPDKPSDLGIDAAERIVSAVRPFFKAGHRESILFTLGSFMVMHGVSDSSILRIADRLTDGVSDRQQFMGGMKNTVSGAKRRLKGKQLVAGRKALLKALTESAAQYKIEPIANDVVRSIIDMLPPPVIQRNSLPPSDTGLKDGPIRVLGTYSPDQSDITFVTAYEAGVADEIRQLNDAEDEMRALKGDVMRASRGKRLFGGVCTHAHIPPWLIDRAVRSGLPLVTRYLHYKISKCKGCRDILEERERILMQEIAPTEAGPVRHDQAAAKHLEKRITPRAGPGAFKKWAGEILAGTKPAVAKVSSGKAPAVEDTFKRGAAHGGSTFSLPYKHIENGDLAAWVKRRVGGRRPVDKVIFNALEIPAVSPFSASNPIGMHLFEPAAFQPLNCDAAAHGNRCPGRLVVPTSTTDHLDPKNEAWILAQYLLRADGWLNERAWFTASYCCEIRVGKIEKLSKKELGEAERAVARWNGRVLERLPDSAPDSCADEETERLSITYSAAFEKAERKRSETERVLRESGHGGITAVVVTPYAVWVVILTDLPYNGYRGVRLPGVWRGIPYIPEHPAVWVDAIYTIGLYDQDYIHFPIPFLQSWDPRMRDIVAGYETDSTSVPGLLYSRKLVTHFGTCRIAEKPGKHRCPHGKSHDDGMTGKLVPSVHPLKDEESAVGMATASHDAIIVKDPSLLSAECPFCRDFEFVGGTAEASTDVPPSGPGPPDIAGYA